MKKFTDWMEQKFVPKAAKIASQSGKNSITKISCSY